MKSVSKCILGSWVMICLAQQLPAAEIKPLLQSIKTIGTKGKGNAKAKDAWRALIKCGPDALLPTLEAMNTANPVAANWLRAAVECIVDRSVDATKKLPLDKLESFVKNSKNAGAVRRLAFESLQRVDAGAFQRLIPGMLDDPGAEFRRDAVRLIIQEADLLFAKKDRTAALTGYQKALVHARDKDQVEHVAKRLKDIGLNIDLTKHFRFITRWLVIGPFDNRKGVGYAKNDAPEKGVQLTATLAGRDKKELRWKEHHTQLAYGLVDLNVALGKNMGSTAYAFAVADAPREMPVQIRVGSNNAIKIFLNGKAVFGREEYHHGMAMDQHMSNVTLKAGRNEILVKVCQNEQTESWAQTWSFQLRVCDAIGGPVPVEPVLIKPEAAKKGGK